MLNIYFTEFSDTPGNKRIAYDVEESFSKIIGKVIDTYAVHKLIADIDKGTYLDMSHFVDRFGNKLPMSALSTGCKAGLCTLFSEDIISMQECGANAISAIIWYCKQGSILLDFDYHGLISFDAPEIDVLIRDYYFKDMLSLVDYIENIFPDAPKSDMKGVAHV